MADATDQMRATRQSALGNQSHADARMRAVAAAENDHRLSDTLWAGITTIRHGAGGTIVETEAPETALPALAVMYKQRPNSSTISLINYPANQSRMMCQSLMSLVSASC